MKHQNYVHLFGTTGIWLLSLHVKHEWTSFFKETISFARLASLRQAALALTHSGGNYSFEIIHSASRRSKQLYLYFRLVSSTGLFLSLLRPISEIATFKPENNQDCQRTQSRVSQIFVSKSVLYKIRILQLKEFAQRGWNKLCGGEWRKFQNRKCIIKMNCI